MYVEHVALLFCNLIGLQYSKLAPYASCARARAFIATPETSLSLRADTEGAGHGAKSVWLCRTERLGNVAISLVTKIRTEIYDVSIVKQYNNVELHSISDNTCSSALWWLPSAYYLYTLSEAF